MEAMSSNLYDYLVLIFADADIWAVDDDYSDVLDAIWLVFAQYWCFSLIKPESQSKAHIEREYFKDTLHVSADIIAF
jgi:hypothetical protein